MAKTVINDVVTNAQSLVVDSTSSKNTKNTLFKDFSYELFGSKWKVKFVDSIQNEDGFLLGVTMNDRNTILISTLNLSGESLSKEQIKLTVLHEVFHSIFYSGQYLQSTGDEPLVEWCARCIFKIHSKLSSVLS